MGNNPQPQQNDAAANARKPRLKVNSFDDLNFHEKKILERISKYPNGGKLFMIHPFALLHDIGVDLSEDFKKELISREPNLRAVSIGAYNALKNSKEKQSIQFHMRGLFRRYK
jgi:hypothetical protein